jgi:hypothetical protein
MMRHRHVADGFFGLSLSEVLSQSTPVGTMLLFVDTVTVEADHGRFADLVPTRRVVQPLKAGDLQLLVLCSQSRRRRVIPNTGAGAPAGAGTGAVAGSGFAAGTAADADATAAGVGSGTGACALFQMLPRVLSGPGFPRSVLALLRSHLTDVANPRIFSTLSRDVALPLAVRYAC